MRYAAISVLALAALAGMAACSKPAANTTAASAQPAGGDAAATPTGGFSFDADPCKAVLDAKFAQARAPASAVTFTQAAPGQPPKTGESRRLDGVSYYLVNGGWISKAQSADDLVAELKDVSKDAKMTCKATGDETVAGQATTIYDAKIDNMDSLSESQVWISKTTGLPLKSHTTMEGGGVIDQTYVYSGVTAPPAAKS